MSGYVGNRSDSAIIDLMLDGLEDRGYDPEDLDSVVMDWKKNGGEQVFWDRVLGPAADRLEEALGNYGLTPKDNTEGDDG